MVARKTLLWAVGTALFFILPAKTALLAQSADAMRPAGVEVQTRGPVHEAFAQPNDQVAGPGPAVPKEPPPVIAELPPEERPQGDNVQWLGGYWAWDAERNDFVWVTGTYRNAPPGRQFIPGRWVNTPDGWRWVSGYWATAGEGETPYVDQPPAPLATEPSVPPPEDNSMYVPGYWAYANGAFAWRTGFYSPYRPGRVWLGPRYVWTPSGYVFVGGYWDYPLEDRGLLFAPVWFNRPLWATTGWNYRPEYVVLRNALFDSLFWRSGWNHYYFGNFYGPTYARLGFQPWFAHRYDPLFNYYRWNNRSQANWLAGHQRVFNDRIAGRAPLPPRTFAQQTTGNRIVAPLSQVSSNQVRLARVAPSTQVAGVQRSNQAAQARLQHENAVMSKGVGTSVRNGNPLSLGNAPRSNTTASAPRVLNNATANARIVTSHGTPRIVNHTPAPAKVAAPQARAVGHVPQQHVAQHHVTPHTNHAGRTINHTPARSGGNGGHHGKR
jgi:hypothetical protein